ncbi:hypothetical protein J2Y69_002143 [Microbacterium resistens]|uniref:Concanavalin A-like lectin/glucanases superfamily protein n=1 Tax=Microbacterium resistens TaxID=156977 RepID=A0ABU1SD71_9MICO|nr:LamG-like jellyroll fold domain-containing protein [Microbacterium resistens]MDR6867539.1 hypothetical protein [Microbacterium resistens]
MSTVQVYGNAWTFAGVPIPPEMHPELWFRPKTEGIGSSGLLVAVEVKANLQADGAFTVQLEADTSVYYQPVLRWLIDPTVQLPERWDWQYAEWDFLVVPGNGGNISDLANNFPPGAIVAAYGPPIVGGLVWIDLLNVTDEGAAVWSPVRNGQMVASQMVLVGRLALAAPATMAMAIRTPTDARNAVDERVTAKIADHPEVAEAAAEAVTDAMAAQHLSYSLVWATAGTVEVAGTVAAATGAPAYTAAGRFGTALSAGSVTASGGGVVVEPGSGVTYTIEGWVKAAGLPTGASRRVFFALSGQGLYVAGDATTGYASATTDSNRRWTSTTNICDGAWHHIAVTFTRASNATTVVGFWIDGAVASGAAAGTPVPAAWDSAVRLGGLSVSSSFDWYGAGSAGLIDEVRISKTARYTAAFTPPGAAFAWDANTLVLAHMNSTAYSYAGVGHAYPARPSGAPGGAVTYLGPVQPTDWLPKDRWIEVPE